MSLTRRRAVVEGVMVPDHRFVGSMSIGPGMGLAWYFVLTVILNCPEDGSTIRWSNDQDIIRQLTVGQEVMLVERQRSFLWWKWSEVVGIELA